MVGGHEPRFPSEGWKPTGRAFSNPPLVSFSPSHPLLMSHPYSPSPYCFTFYSLPSPDIPPLVCPPPHPINSDVMTELPGHVLRMDEPPEPLEAQQHSHTSIRSTHAEWINSTSSYQHGLKGRWWKIKSGASLIKQASFPVPHFSGMYLQAYEMTRDCVPGETITICYCITRWLKEGVFLCVNVIMQIS